MKIEHRPAGRLSRPEQQHLRDWERRIFGPSEYRWARPDWHVLVWVDGELASHVGILERVASVDGRRVKLGGIGDVMTLPAWRRRGLASAAVQDAAAFLCQELGVEFGLLLCADFRVPFYARLGWQRVAGPLVFDQPSGTVTSPLATMVLPCGARQWPAGTIDLHGLPW